LDATPAAVTRGAVNGAIAISFENGDREKRRKILKNLVPHTGRSIRAAVNELKYLPLGWKRRPVIRFAHVGEIAAFPDFANSMALQVRDMSNGGVDCVVYTRHRRAVELDPSLWVINFTLDKSSLDRRSWSYPHMRIVYAAFGGELSQDASVNFLEHHRWFHASPIGNGEVCPATAPENPERTCDAMCCDKCFRPIVGDEIEKND
jgi:hypothetical protein